MNLKNLRLTKVFWPPRRGPVVAHRIRDVSPNCHSCLLRWMNDNVTYSILIAWESVFETCLSTQLYRYWLISRGYVTQMSVCYLVQHWFRYWLVDCSATNHHLNQRRQLDPNEQTSVISYRISNILKAKRALENPFCKKMAIVFRTQFVEFKTSNHAYTPI